jgi:hypothetical protein
MIDVSSHTKIIDAFDKAIKKKILRLHAQVELAKTTYDRESRLAAENEIVHLHVVELIAYLTKSGEDKFNGANVGN